MSRDKDIPGIQVKKPPIQRSVAQSPEAGNIPAGKTADQPIAHPQTHRRHDHPKTAPDTPAAHHSRSAARPSAPTPQTRFSSPSPADANDTIIAHPPNHAPDNSDTHNAPTHPAARNSLARPKAG